MSPEQEKAAEEYRAARAAAEQTAQGVSSSPPTPSPGSNVADWGGLSNAMCFIGGLIALVGGLYLFSIKAQGQNSMIESLANGIGVYCIGKGLFMMAATTHFRAGLQAVMKRIG